MIDDSDREYVETSTIARYQNGWEYVNNLKTGRLAANAIQYNGKIMVVGGHVESFIDGHQGYDTP